MTRYGGSSDDERELDRLRTELAHRFDTHPTDEWDAPLLRALIAVFDLAYAENPDQPQPVKLTVVGVGTRPHA